MRISSRVAGFAAVVVTGVCAEAAVDVKPYLDSVQRFAATVMEQGRDRYGEVRTPLFIDGLHAETLEPTIWKGKGGRDWYISNFAGQQPLMQFLDGMTMITGDAKYREAAEAATRYMLENGANTKTGMLPWGDHAAWDLLTETPVGTKSEAELTSRDEAFVHDLKTEPHYEMFWRVNPAAARKVAFGHWAGHITNWETLDFNRHANTRRLRVNDWNQPFDEKGAVPFITEGGNLSFAGVVPNFIQSSIALALFDKDMDALKWTRRMVEQWQRNRHPKTGLSGGQISWRKGHDRAISALGHRFPQINEAIFMATYHQSGRYHSLPLAQLQQGQKLIAAGEPFAAVGREFIAWAVDDLKVYGRRVFDEEKGIFRIMLADGTPITDEDIADMKPGYYTPEDLQAIRPSSSLLWGYAMAYRLKRDPECWEMARKLGRFMGLGEFGEVDGKGRALAYDTSNRDWNLIYALVELERAAGKGDFIRLAARIGDNQIAFQSPTGLFPRPAPDPLPPGTVANHAKIPGTVQPARKFARTGDEIAPALLYLVAALQGKEALLPQPPAAAQRWHVRYFGPLADYQKKRDDSRTHDWLVFYGPDLVW
ncbi:MAG TPA: hypothetical protein PKE12_12595 [Kiritimatiellia bacterium]|nr:hypothetical protein [Kiritimatiellia bacterium]